MAKIKDVAETTTNHIMATAILLFIHQTKSGIVAYLS